MNWTKLPPIEPKNVHQGCACCPTPSIHAPMERPISVGFGSADVTKDGEHYYDGEGDWQHDKEPKTIGEIEKEAAEDPDHDWRICFLGPLHGETYQRQGDGKWVMIESNMGFA